MVALMILYLVEARKELILTDRFFFRRIVIIPGDDKEPPPSNFLVQPFGQQHPVVVCKTMFRVHAITLCVVLLNL